jgi:AraC family transcriptional regulator, transcriptional activator of pobA
MPRSLRVIEPATIHGVSILRTDPGDVEHGGLRVDRLADPAEAIEVVLIDGLEVCSDVSAREPHRHEYHELIWAKTGEGHHLLDEKKVPVEAGTVTVIGRGQVHVFERAHDITGAAVRFGDELVHDATSSRTDPSWLLLGCGGRVVRVPEGEIAALEATIAALAAENARAQDECTVDLQRHLLSVLLLWLERWYDADAAQPDAGDEALQLYRRFARVLERDFASHHDVAHYADALAVPPAALSQALVQAGGRSTKELIIDRVMVEAGRLLRYTERTMGEVAFLTGFSDPLYFSRAFKRHQGVAPSAYRERVHGRV